MDPMDKSVRVMVIERKYIYLAAIIRCSRNNLYMRKLPGSLVFLQLILIQGVLHAQSAGKSGTEGSGTYYRIQDAYFIENDSTIVLKNWTDQGMNMFFKPVRDSLIISIDIGGADKIFFMGMAVTMDNPGFITTSSQSDFYHWIFVSHIKEGMHNAYIHKEYIDGSLEKMGKKHYFINIAFTDQTEFQLYGYELKPQPQNKK